ncbi:MAG: hypothetical protein M3O50_16475 [Myxococcota bacterium]|nr:hypothetical protein [Myxococcota bacterium]
MSSLPPPTRTIPPARHTLLARWGALALIFAAASCLEGSAVQSVGAEGVVAHTTSQGLTAGAIQWINGTYGAACILTPGGAWSARVSGSNAMTNSTLRVVKNNTACVLSVTALMADQIYTGTPSIAMTTAYQGSASVFRAAGAVAFYANALLSATTFASDFIVSVLVSSDATAGTAGNTSTLQQNTLKWFGTGNHSQGAWDQIARRSPQQEATAATTWSALTSGSKASCGVRTDGTLWCWGDNGSGQLGIGNVLPKSSPIQVGTSTQWTSVSTSGQHTCGVRSTGAGNGTIYCWGKNESGQVGNGGTVTPQLAPVLVSGGFTNWIAVAAGGSVAAGASHTCGIRSTGAGNGTLYCWGSNGSGELGTGNTTASSTPVLITPAALNWTGVSAGSLHTCGTHTTGHLLCWGDNTFGQVGIGSVVTPQTTPVQVGVAATWNGISAAADASHSCATRTDGTLWCWGTNTDGEVGIGSVVTPQTSPAQVGALTTWRNVSAGRTDACATKTDNTLWCWGKNDVGQLGIGSVVTPQKSPVQVGALTVWSAAAAGSTHSCALRTGGGTAWCWGQSLFGQVGLGQFDDSSAVTPVGINAAWKTATSGFGHSCATRADGTLWCWGSNANGQVGIGSTADPQSTPVQVGSVATWTGVSGGNLHTCATRSDGTLWCWGDNSNGQLGIGNTTQQTSPVQVGVATTWASVVAGDHHTCAIRSNGTLWCWGLNANGQVGIGSTATPQQSPVQVGTATTWSSVGAGFAHTCGTQSDGTLWCWGVATSGQTGQGNATQQTSPIKVGVATDWSTVSAGKNHSCAIKTGGALWCWGENLNGEIGINSVVSPQSTPVQVGTVTTWNSLAMGYDLTCAGRTDQTLWCWGKNDIGQVGIGNNVTPQMLPAQVPMYDLLRNVYGGSTSSTSLVTTVGPAAYRALIEAAAPVGYWPMDDTNSPATVANVAYPAEYGTPVGGGSVTYGQTGLITKGTSIAFSNTNATTNKVTVPYDPPLDSNGDFSVETWLNVTSATTASMSAITSRETATAKGYSIYVQANNAVTFVLGNGASFVTVTGPTITTGTTHHVVGTYVKSTGVATLYVDGLSSGTATAASYTPASPGIPVYIGCGGTEGTGQFGFNGRIDETAIYNRALPLAEIANHYEVGTNAITGAGKALYFDGTSYVDIGAQAIPADFTFEAWILRDASTLEGTVMAKDRAAQAAGQCRLAVDSAGHLYFEGSDSSGSDHGLWNTTFSVLSPGVIPVGTWTHVAVTKSGANFVLYVNGVSVISFTASANFVISGPATSFRIGSRVASDGVSMVLPFAGVIDEVRVWNVARTQAKISANMAASIAATNTDFPSLVGYWHLDEGAGTTTADATGGLIGTLVSSPLWVTSSAY